MQRMVFAIFAASIILQPIGCGDYEPADLPAPPKQAAEEQPAVEHVEPDLPEPVEKKTPEAVAEPEPEPKPGPVAESQPPKPAERYVPSRPPAIVAPQMPISLDLGVALGQPGPNGTMMMFNVEYEFVVGEPDPKAEYVWVIERAKGAPKKLKVQLQNKNTLIAPIDGWRPEHGPLQIAHRGRQGQAIVRLDRDAIAAGNDAIKYFLKL